MWVSRTTIISWYRFITIAIHIILCISLILSHVEKWLKIFHYTESSEDSILLSLESYGYISGTFDSIKTSQKNHSHLMISFSNHYHLYYFVRISSIKAGRELFEDFLLRRIKQRSRFWYHWRARDTELVILIALNTSHIIVWIKRTFVHRI